MEINFKRNFLGSFEILDCVELNLQMSGTVMATDVQQSFVLINRV